MKNVDSIVGFDAERRAAPGLVLELSSDWAAKRLDRSCARAESCSASWRLSCATVCCSWKASGAGAVAVPLLPLLLGREGDPASDCACDGAYSRSGSAPLPPPPFRVGDDSALGAAEPACDGAAEAPPFVNEWNRRDRYGLAWWEAAPRNEENSEEEEEDAGAAAASEVAAAVADEAEAVPTAMPCSECARRAARGSWRSDVCN